MQSAVPLGRCLPKGNCSEDIEAYWELVNARTKQKRTESRRAH